ncbi:MAG: CotH kinase family protein [Tannerella sp.]|jgi:hypothetical protein|nr:CotH kinase family protein [Tannerella sp.]
MRYTFFAFFLISLLIISCDKDHNDFKDDIENLNNNIDSLNNDINELENDINGLHKDIEKLQGVIDLQSACIGGKKIVSAVETSADEKDIWLFTFEDNTSVQLPKSVVISVTKNEATSEYTIKLSNEQVLVFNSRAMVYPTSLVLLTTEIKFMANTEVSLEFRVNPSNAIFNYDVGSQDCQIELDMTSAPKTYSYVTTPTLYNLVRIEQAKDAFGNILTGQYKAFIRDKGSRDPYKTTTSLVLTTADRNGDTVQISTASIPLERKKYTGLPVVVIHTNNNAEIKDKVNWVPAEMTIDGMGKYEDYEGTMAIRGRGNSTWPLPKKPFAIKLDSKSSILGMPEHKRWVLLANYVDRTMIRNHIAFEIARTTGLEWTPRGQFVELMINDCPLGNYYLCEQIKIDENRVNITGMSSSDLDEEAITGGYLLEFDSHFDEVNKFRSAKFNLPVMIQDPDEETLQPAQFEYIRTYIDSLERLLTNSDSLAARAYTRMIADTTFIDWWIVMELTTNHESYVPNSLYMYKDRMDVLKAGPVWDFDLKTFGADQAFVTMNGIIFKTLFKDPVFTQKAKERWANFKPAFTNIAAQIDSLTLALQVSAEVNTEIWPLEKRWSIPNFEPLNGDEFFPYTLATSTMKSNYVKRISSLDWLIRNLN